MYDCSFFDQVLGLVGVSLDIGASVYSLIEECESLYILIQETVM